MVIEIIPKEDMKNSKMLSTEDKDIGIEIKDGNIKDISNIYIDDGIKIGYGIRGEEGKLEDDSDSCGEDRDNACSPFYKMRISDYRNKLSGYVDNFKEMIRNGGGQAEIKLRYIRDILGEGYGKWEDKTDDAIYCRLRDILLEYGINVKLHHHHGANIIMSFIDISRVDIIELQRMRYLKSAIAAGFSTNAEYKRYGQPGYRSKLKYGTMEEATECTLYLGSYIKKEFISKLFHGAERNPVPLGPYSKRSYDWICNSGDNHIKIKHIASTIRTRDELDVSWRDGSIKERIRKEFKWSIYGNKEADVFVLTGWKDRKSLELMKCWIFDKNEFINGRKFSDRQSFSISLNPRTGTFKKYTKYEVDVERGLLGVVKREIENRKRLTYKMEWEEKIREILIWYKIYFR
jgi:hypothetical protein